MRKEIRSIEGDNWSKRTEQFFKEWEENWPKSDPLATDIIRQKDIIHANTDILEIGCGSGYRLKKLKEKYNCKIHGIDCSELAVRKARLNGVNAECRDIIEWDNKMKYDIVIMGFFLYMCENDELWEIGSKVDRILKAKGKLIIYDFDANETVMAKYKHIEGEVIAKRDYKAMFIWNPDYRLLREESYSEYPQKGAENKKEVRVTTLKKN